ncbi:beta-galactosidase trimerization domain-containing protein [Coraliomargarita sp. SDUM461004]|uniref:Beta-galactosidase trimerization domain-containing protein n=1 Tax=Thalassobacterium sedimentorum TaxID=3041258 RepID=A0ABU1AGI6_9BACT|nr:beta-galactosidase trimerization domain-containing protein [Coraliomargarita sp. SDUM461004]MDQ8192876.1 beta-galactosidase trimerization domain-containing protein [Coraliomargarita sp. SDUM461004]
MTTSLRFRQIHLDFHTSGAIAGIGTQFDKAAYQATLQRAAVNSVSTFATCHHGWSYYDTKVGKRHPGLSFDLLRAQFDACKEVGINVPIYLTAGVHNLAADEHPEWREISPEGKYSGWTDSNLKPGFKMLSFHSPYLDYLCEQVKEVMHLFPNADGIFLDIISQNEDCSVWALQHMQAKGLDPLKPEDRRQSRLDGLMKYYQRVTETVRSIDPNMPIFHNSGHVTPGYRDILQFFSHLELESLPTGGWGYDHFPMSAKYAHKLDLDYLGMTGKFHSTWGEFGGYKHPNALRYECCAMLAFGAKCSVGDQLHPDGTLDESTYEIIGAAYREVAQKEIFVQGAKSYADVGLICSAAVHGADSFLTNRRERPSDTGAGRMLLEAHVLFDVLDIEMDFSNYKLLILPDDVDVVPELEVKLKAYLAEGGMLLLTGSSGIDPKRGMLFDVGAEVGELSEYSPDYVLPRAGLRADFVNRPMVMYAQSHRVKVTDGESFGDVYDPYFNRQWDHFCSHQHAPNQPEASGFSCGVRKGNIAYLAHPIFSIYRSYGQVALRQYFEKILAQLMAEDRSLNVSGLPSNGRVSLMHQSDEQRFILHLLYANTINRGGAVDLHGGNISGAQQSYEVIEDLVPLTGLTVEIRLNIVVNSVRLEPSGESLEFEQINGIVYFKVAELLCHQMIVLTY